jgi:hypothetical protein
MAGDSLGAGDHVESCKPSGPPFARLTFSDGVLLGCCHIEITENLPKRRRNSDG